MNKIILPAAVLCGLPITAFADTYPEFNINVVSVMQANNSKADPILGTGTKDKDLTTYQFEHFSTFKYGDIYLDAELYEGNQVGGPGAGSGGGNASSQNLLVANPRLSLGKMTGRSFAYGPVSDVSLIARWERASYGDFRSRNYGVSLNFNVPGFMYFESGLLQRTTNYNDATWLWRSYLISKPWEIAGQQFNFTLLSLINGTDHNGTEYFTRPELLWHVDKAGAFQLGVRVETHHYQIAGDGYERITPQLIFKWFL